jgi:Domain of Unknown Function (DUF928)
MKKHFYWQIITIVTTGLWLTTTSLTLAEYKPPRKQKPPTTRTITTGSRGSCESQGDANLKLFAPQSHVGQTASIRPTFAWFVPDSQPLPMEFKLYKYDSQGHVKLKQKFSMLSKTGIMTLTLPKNRPSLEIGQRYLWEITILCDGLQPANNVFSMAEIDVIKIPKQLNSVSLNRQNINSLAEAGLWYDAMGAALKNKDKQSFIELIKTLSILEKSPNPEN